MDISKSDYLEVFELATLLINAQQVNDTISVWNLYNKLKLLVEMARENGQEHPFFYETLADFTFDSQLAIEYYNIGLKLATELSMNDYSASIQLAMARKFYGTGALDDAIKNALAAKNSAANVENEELKNEILDFIALVCI